VGILALVVLASAASCGGSVSSESTTTTTSSSGAATSGGGATGVSTASGSTAAGTGGASSGGAVTGVTGNKLDVLSFAVVGDTRPANEDDTAGYPTDVITQIWKDVEAASPRPAFGVTTGDYMFAQPYGAEAAPQLDKYLGARAAFSNTVFPAMGNHECTGSTTSNCGQGNKDGITVNFTTFTTKMLAPHGLSKPYYTVDVASPTNAWTAKFVFVAANAWDQTQANWLDAELAKPTTYTFVVRHESLWVSSAPGVSPSYAIVAKHPVTLTLVGHTHEYSYTAQDHEVIIGNGGAPLTGNSNYGYVIARQRSDGAVVFTSYDYMTKAVVETFALKADGSAAP
jgi:hypothetical protein